MEDDRSVTSRFSQYSRASSGLSDKEVDKIKRWMSEKDKEERRCNIIIRGIEETKEMEGDKNKGCTWLREWFRDKLEVECKVEECRVSGKVIVVKLSNSEQKEEIMKNKNRLRGGSIFIANDLSWEDRKIQEKINRWAKEQRDKGKKGENQKYKKRERKQRKKEGKVFVLECSRGK